MKTSDLTQKHFDDFNIIERTCSVFSLIGCIFIILTFLSSNSFRRPITRLVFFASFGNMMTNIATLMATSYLGMPDSAGCQFQGFLIQMFMAADAYWTLAMAVNVYLTFNRKYDAQRLKKMEVPYLIACYVAPFIIALTYIFVRSPSQARMYGNALLWCWVTTSWDIWRIITFYGPVWVTIFITFFIYIRTGRQIYRKYKALRSLNTHSHPQEPLLITEPFSTKTTEIYVTSDIVSTSVGLEGNHMGHVDHRASVAVGHPLNAYSVEITADPDARQNMIPVLSHHDVNYDEEEDVNEMMASILRAENDFSSPTSPISRTEPPTAPMSGTTPMVVRTMTGTSMRATTVKIRRNRRKLAVYEANNAAWSYTKCAFLFFTALLITWIPSTANRVYSVVNQNQISLGLQYASAFVLPLQGFWNGLIYMFTTRKACKKLLGDIFYYLFPQKSVEPNGSQSFDNIVERHRSRPGPNSKQSKDRNSFVMGLVPGKGKAGLGLPVEPYERI